MIMGSRGFGASRRVEKGRLGSVSDYCVTTASVPRWLCATLMVLLQQVEAMAMPWGMSWVRCLKMSLCTMKHRRGKKRNESPRSH
uniref:Uncharacterized protein n=1 Tax=Arundo donax TaxID=35708 RepID=A0A0A9F4J0_ARUDO